MAVLERNESMHYALTAIDAHGRLSDRSLMRTLRWEPGQRIAFSAAPGALLVLPRPEGPDSITQQGHLRLPAALRHSFGIKPGERILLVAFPDQALLVAYTIAALDAMVLAYHRSATYETLR